MLFCGWAMKNNRAYKDINFQLLGLMLSVSLASSFGIVTILSPWLVASEGVKNNQALLEQNQELIHQQQELIEAIEQSGQASPKVRRSIPEAQIPTLKLSN